MDQSFIDMLCGSIPAIDNAANLNFPSPSTSVAKFDISDTCPANFDFIQPLPSKGKGNNGKNTKNKRELKLNITVAQKKAEEARARAEREKRKEEEKTKKQRGKRNIEGVLVASLSNDTPKPKRGRKPKTDKVEKTVIANTDKNIEKMEIEKNDKVEKTVITDKNIEKMKIDESPVPFTELRAVVLFRKNELHSVDAVRGFFHVDAKEDVFNSSTKRAYKDENEINIPFNCKITLNFKKGELVGIDTEKWFDNINISQTQRFAGIDEESAYSDVLPNPPNSVKMNGPIQVVDSNITDQNELERLFHSANSSSSLHPSEVVTRDVTIQPHVLDPRKNGLSV